MNNNKLLVITFLIAFAIIISSANAFILNPFDIGNEMSKRMADSNYTAYQELNEDPSLIAACHMEFWRNQTNEIYTDGSGIHKGSLEGGALNYVCYYKDGKILSTKIGYYNSYRDAVSIVFWYYHGYFNGNNGWVYNIE
jgi:hypothetical protein